MSNNTSYPYSSGANAMNYGWNSAAYNGVATLPRQEVVTVNGRQGAQLYQIGVNSSAFLLDVSGKILWLVTTDGAGYKTVQPYDITPHQDPPSPEFEALATRMSRLEDMINGLCNATERATSGDTANTTTIKSGTDSTGNKSTATDYTKQF